MSLQLIFVPGFIVYCTYFVYWVFGFGAFFGLIGVENWGEHANLFCSCAQRELHEINDHHDVDPSMYNHHALCHSIGPKNHGCNVRSEAECAAICARCAPNQSAVQLSTEEWHV